MRLDISHNRLLRIEDSTFLRLSRLSLLDLSHNTELVLETRGRSFKGLEDSLLELHLCNTSLVSTPELLLPALRTLHLAQNHIQDIPVEVARSLNSLQQLDVSYNQLRVCPLSKLNTTTWPIAQPQLKLAHNKFPSLNSYDVLTHTATMIVAAKFS